MTVEGFPQHLTLRDGAEVVVRPLEAADANALLEFYRSLAEADRQFLTDDVTKPEWLERFLHRVAVGEVVSLIAEHQGNLIGEATLYRALHGWTSHVGELRVSTAPEFRRKGLGTVLAHEVVRVATSLGLEKLIVEMVENQVAARRTFAKLGFKEEAVLRGHVKDIHGVKHNLVVASNDVSHIWEAMEALVADFSPTSG
ncbi:MAG: GNAT family N-acetyltransferase [Thermoanaerobaculales bacterium]